jgi:ribosomal protein S18 acetylase RimI-like enzyme
MISYIKHILNEIRKSVGVKLKFLIEKTESFSYIEHSFFCTIQVSKTRNLLNFCGTVITKTRINEVIKMTINPIQMSIRTGNINDAEAVLELEKEVLSENEFMISVIEEFKETSEQLRSWIQKILENEREQLIVAEINREVVGLIVFRSNSTKRLSHTGSFTAMVRKEYRNQGIGKLLIEALLNWAEQNPLIEKVSLGVLSTNQRAIELYKSMGFIEEGRKIKEVKFNQDVYVDDILMYKFV